MRTKEGGEKLLASLAVFRELYNSKKDVYGVIATFLEGIINQNSLYSFSLNEIYNKFKTTFEFDIPRAVIKTSLGRLKYIEKIKSKHDIKYTIKDISKLRASELDEKQNIINQNNNKIIKGLYSFIEGEIHKDLNEKEREIILNSFCNFLLEESIENDYIKYISAYVIKNENDVNFKKQLNTIREGVILYTGIKYNHDINDFGSWRTELTIFLETEILFHLAGYNGELFQILVTDLFNLIKEINQKAKKRLIRFKYFIETKDEIERFFKKAEYIIEGQERLNPDVTAMSLIIKGNKTPADILSKKSDFYSLLKSHNIVEDEYSEYFEDYNHKYNVINKEIIEKVSDEIKEDAFPYLKLLNFISILRKDNKTNNFENIKYILLSGNSITLKTAWHELLKDDGDVPLATNMGFLTNKFWFKLNKGFGSNTLPKSFDVITKAQISLSKILNENVGEKYHELINEYQKGQLTEEQAKARIADLRNQVRNPEEIKEDTIKDVLESITEDSLEKFIEEQEHFKTKVKKQEQENKILKDNLSKKEKEIQQTLKQKKLLNDELIKTKENLLNEKITLKKEMEKTKNKLDTKAKKKFNNFKKLLTTIIILYYISLVISIFYFGWDTMEKYTYILSLIPIIASILYLIIFERNLNFIKFISLKKEKYFNKTYMEFAFDINKLEKINMDIEKLSLEIDNLKTSS